MRWEQRRESAAGMERRGSATTHLMEPGRRPSPIDSEMSYLHPINSHTTHQDEAPHGVSMGQASEPASE